VYLFAALVPPRQILDELWSVVEAHRLEPVRAPRPPGWRKARRKARRDGSATGDLAPRAVLDLAPIAHVQLPLAKFGNLAMHDADRLVAALGRAAPEWSSPRLRFAGYTTLESEKDPSVWVDLEGDNDDLNAMVRGVHDVAKSLRLFVDRRVFQPRVRLGGVEPTTSEPELEALLAELDAFETNAWWQTTFGLLTPVEQGRDHTNYKTYAEIPLGPHVVH
jgi:2'-5' RNA ligase